jgi:hypothetical protein
MEKYRAYLYYSLFLSAIKTVFKSTPVEEFTVLLYIFYSDLATAASISLLNYSTFLVISLITAVIKNYIYIANLVVVLFLQFS